MLLQENKRNIAILAHVDAGKTTVSERLLYFSDAISGTGEVDEGLATMDYLLEEKKRGITIEAGIASYDWKNIHVTFVDTPGHVDFGVEVDFALQSVEGVVLVISGLSGVESQTLAGWEKILRNKNRPLLFINKLDLPGADYTKALEQIRVLFQARPVVLAFPLYHDGKIHGVVDVLHQVALFRAAESPRRLIKGEIPHIYREEYDRFRHQLVDFASQYNDTVLEAYLSGVEIESSALMDGLRKGLARNQGVPVFMGSALKNVGIRQLLNGINQLLPPPTIPNEAAETLGFVIKIRWYPGVGRIYLAKLFAKPTSKHLEGARFYRVFAERLEETHDAEAGDLLAIQTDRTYTVGQFLKPVTGESVSRKGYRPLLQTRLELVDPEDNARVNEVLKELTDVDPSIQIEPDLVTGGWILRAVGELQLDVFCNRLKNEHDCNVRIGAPTVRYLEKLKAPHAGLTNEATGFGTEARISIDANLQSNDENQITFSSKLKPIEEEVLRDCFDAFCSQGVCGLGEIAGVAVNVRELKASVSPIPPPLLAKVFNDCLKLNLNPPDFEVFEPIMKLEIIVPEEYCGAVLSDLASRNGVIRKIDTDGRNSIIFLEIPLENTFGYTTLLRSLSKGLGVFVLTYEKHGVKKRS